MTLEREPTPPPRDGVITMLRWLSALQLIGLVAAGLLLMAVVDERVDHVARLAGVIVLVVAVGGRVALRLLHGRLQERERRASEREAQAAARALSAQSSTAALQEIVEPLRVSAAEIAAHAGRALAEARAAEAASEERAEALERAARALREQVEGPEAVADAGSSGIDSRSDGAPAAELAGRERMDRLAAQQADAAEAARVLAAHLAAIASGHAALADAVTALEEHADRADALALRSSPSDPPAGVTIQHEEIASELGAIAQEMAACNARAKAALDASREATSRAVLAARAHASATAALALLGKDLATTVSEPAQALDARRREAASARETEAQAAAARKVALETVARDVGAALSGVRAAARDAERINAALAELVTVATRAHGGSLPAARTP